MLIRAIKAALLLLLLPAFAWADDTGWKVAGTVTSCGSGWSNCDSTAASDDKRATHAATSNNEMILTNFSMGVTAGATLDSIIVRIEGHGDYSNNCTRRTEELTLTHDASTSHGETNSQCLDYATDNTHDVTGTLSALWNYAFTAAQVNGSNFGVKVVNAGGKSDAVYVDYIAIRIVYTPAAEGKSQVMRTVIIE
jgi:hypothetical protein